MEGEKELTVRSVVYCYFFVQEQRGIQIVTSVRNLILIATAKTESPRSGVREKKRTPSQKY